MSSIFCWLGLATCGHVTRDAVAGAPEITADAAFLAFLVVGIGILLLHSSRSKATGRDTRGTDGPSPRDHHHHQEGSC